MLIKIDQSSARANTTKNMCIEIIMTYQQYKSIQYGTAEGKKPPKYG